MKYAILCLMCLTAFACSDDNERTTTEWCDRDDGPIHSVIYGNTETDVCYAPIDDGRETRVVDNGGDINIPQTGNGTTVVFDDDTDGKPIVGDVTLDGNNVTVYGNGADKTIIEGNVVVAGNNARIRGVTIRGSLTVTLNNVAIVDSRVTGDVSITKNSTSSRETMCSAIFAAHPTTMCSSTIVFRATGRSEATMRRVTTTAPSPTVIAMVASTTTRLALRLSALDPASAGG